MASAQTASTKTATRKKRRKEGPLKIVDWYLLSHVIEGTLRGLLWFGGLLFMVTIVSALKSALADEVSMSALVKQILLQMPRIVLFALPMSVLYGTTQAFTELSTESEITALWAGGVSLPRMMVPALGWSIILAVTAFLLQEFIVPKSQLNMETIKRAAIQAAGKGGGFRYDDPPRGKGPLKTVIHAKEFDGATGTLIKPTITIYDVEKQLPEVVIRAEKGQWDLTTNKWKLYNGSTTRFGLSPEGDWIPRNTSRFNAAQNRNTPSPSKLSNSSVSVREEMDKPNFEYVSLRDLIPYRTESYENLVRAENPEEVTELAKKVRILTFGIHDKIATPLLCLALVMVGAPLGIRPPRSKGQSGVALGLSLMVLTVYYITYTWCSKMGEAGVGPPLLLAYLSPTLVLAAGLYLLAHKSR